MAVVGRSETDSDDDDDDDDDDADEKVEEMEAGARIMVDGAMKK